MNGENIIRESSALRGARRFDDAINLIESNIEKISEDIRLNAWLEVFHAAVEKGDDALAREYAVIIVAEDPGIPSIQAYL